MNTEEAIHDTRRMQMFLLGCQGNSQDGSEDEEDYHDLQREYYNLDNPPEEQNEHGFVDHGEYDAPVSDKGSSYQQYVSSPSQSFNSQPVTSDDDSDGEMDLDEQITSGSLPANVENLYKVNQAYQREIEKALEYLHEKLERNRREQASIQELLGGARLIRKENCSTLANLWGTRFYGSPYFMDQDFIPAPPTRDARHFAEAGVVSLTFHKYAPWHKRESEALDEAIQSEAVKKRCQVICEERKVLLNKLHPIVGKCTMTDDERAAAEERCKELSNDLKNQAKLKRSELLGTRDVEHNWLEVARTMQFNLTKNYSILSNRTAEECETFWMNTGHPSLSRGTMRSNEEQQLKELMKDPRVDTNDIEALASYFPDRSEFWVFKELRRLELSEQLDFTEDEEVHFTTLFEANPGFVFADLAQRFLKHFPNHSFHQLHAKFDSKRKVGDVNMQARRLFSRNEDMIILEGYAAGLGPDDIARILPHRTVLSIQYRYKKLKLTGLDNEYKTPYWHRGHDRRLWLVAKKFKDRGWEYIQKTYFPQRTVAECQRRLIFLKYHAKYARRERSREAPIAADLKGKFGKIASHAINSIRGQHYMKSFSGRKNAQFKARRQGMQGLRLYVRPYYCRAGRTRTDMTRNPAINVKAMQSRSSALRIFRYLKFLRAPLPKLVERYNEDPSVVDEEPCSNPGCDTFVPPAVKTHLVHLLSKGEYATGDDETESLPVPDSESGARESISSNSLPPSSQSLLLLRSMLLHREYLILKCAKKDQTSDKKPNIGDARSASNSREPTTNADNGSVPGPSGSDGQGGTKPSGSSSVAPGVAKARATELLFDRLKAILHWPALLATKAPPAELKTAAELLASRTAEEGDEGQYKIGIRGGIIRPKKATMTKAELKKLRSDRLRQTMAEQWKAKGKSSEKACKSNLDEKAPEEPIAGNAKESADASQPPENPEKSCTETGKKKAGRPRGPSKRPIQSDKDGEEPSEKRRSVRLEGPLRRSRRGTTSPVPSGEKQCDQEHVGTEQSNMSG